MDIEEAIKFLKSIYSDRKLYLGLQDDMPGQKALQLGIEALEDLLEFRKKYPNTPKLPSEEE